MDMLQPPKRVAAQMKDSGVHGDYVFFCAYVQPTPPEGGSIWSATDDLVTLNSECILPCWLSNLLIGILSRIALKLPPRP